MIASVQRSKDIAVKGSKKSIAWSENIPKSSLGVSKVKPGGLIDAILKRPFKLRMSKNLRKTIVRDSLACLHGDVIGKIGIHERIM